MTLNFSKRMGALLGAILLASVGCSDKTTTNTITTIPGYLAGVVKTSSGAAIKGVTVTPSTPNAVAAVTDSSGKYSVQVPPGSYTLAFSADNYEPATSAKSYDVGSGATVKVDDQALAASTLTVTVNVPDALKNGGPTGFDVDVAGITVTAKLAGADVTSGSTVTWSVKDYYGLADPPGGAVTFDTTAGGFHIPAFETVREGANAWLNNRYGTAGTADEFEYIHAPPRDQLLSLGVQQLRAMSYKVIAKVTNGGRTTTGSAVIAPATITNGGNYQPLGMMVIGNAAAAGSYAWTLGFLPMSATDLTFQDATSQLKGAATKNPTLVPLTAGVYRLQNGEDAPLYFRVSTYHGAGKSDAAQGADGVACNKCHVGEYALADEYDEWNRSAHGNMNWKDPAATPMALFQAGVDGFEGSHYSESCISCHVVGYSKVPTAVNGGFDDVMPDPVASDDGQSPDPTVAWAFPNPPAPGTYDAMPLRLQHRGAIQCESCHGPLEPADHSQPEGLPGLFPLPVSPRASMSAGVCMVCHDALSNHDRGSLWAASGHSNVELAIEENGRTSCGRCHEAEGFKMYLPKQQAGVYGELTSAEAASLNTMQVNPVTCQVCHNPHSTELRVTTGDTMETAGRFRVQNAGAGALCMICHNSRGGSVKQGTFTIGASSLGRLGPHAAAQGDMFAGRNAFFISNLAAGDSATYLPNLSKHSFMADTCVDCHVKYVPPGVKAQFGVAKTNHVFRTTTEVCAECHAADIGERVQESITAKMGTLQDKISGVLSARLLATGFDTAIGARKNVSTGATLPDPADRTVLAADVRDIKALSTTSAVVVTLNDGSQFQLGIGNICPVNATPCDSTTSPAQITLLLSTGEANTQTMLKAYFNLLYVNNDGAKGVHNPAFAAAVLDNATNALSSTVIP